MVSADAWLAGASVSDLRPDYRAFLLIRELIPDTVVSRPLLARHRR